MNSVISAALFCWGVAIAANAEDTFVVADYGKQPDHLTPVRKVSGDYERRLKEHLFVTDAVHGRMVISPSFSGESSIAVYENASEEVLKRHNGILHLVPNDQKKFVITVTRAAENLYFTMAGGPPDVKESKKVKIERFDAEIPASLAVAIQRAWVAMLQRTRYPSHAYAGDDGTGYQFAVWVRNLGDLEGEISSPSSGLPLRMVQLGEEMMKLAMAKRTVAEKEAELLIGKLREFEVACAPQ
jgi:hypothetical protein